MREVVTVGSLFLLFLTSTRIAIQVGPLDRLPPLTVQMTRPG